MNLLVESDNSIVIDKLVQDISDNSYTSYIISDCQLLVCDFGSVIFSHVCREGNRVVNGLVELAQIFNFHVPMFWLENAHYNILPLTVSDILE